MAFYLAFCSGKNITKTEGGWMDGWKVGACVVSRREADY